MKKNPFQNTAATTHTTNTTKRRRRQPENCRQGWNRIPVFVCNWKQLFKRLNEKQEESIMSKKLKRLSALLLAVVMMFSMSAFASAANMSIYVRDYNQPGKEGKFTYYPADKTPLVTISTIPGKSVYDAIEAATEAGKVSSTWNKVTNSDGSIDEYMESFGVGSFTRTNWGDYSNLKYDSDGNVTSGTWAGSSWMWRLGDKEDLTSTTYPNYTMSDYKCPANDFSIILSFDYSSFSW